MGHIPKAATHTEVNLVSWTEKQLIIDQKIPPMLLDTSFISKYDKEYGFKISIDSAKSLSIREYTIAVTSFTPNFFVLDSEKPELVLEDDIIYSKPINTDSEIRNPVWKDGYHVTEQKKS